MGKGKGYLTWLLQANPLLPLTEWGAIQLECLLFIFQGCALQLHGPLSEGPTWKGSPKRSWKNGWNTQLENSGVPVTWNMGQNTERVTVQAQEDTGLLVLMILHLIVRNMAKEGQNGLPKAQAVQKAVPLQVTIRQDSETVLEEGGRGREKGEQTDILPTRPCGCHLLLEDFSCSPS